MTLTLLLNTSCNNKKSFYVELPDGCLEAWFGLFVNFSNSAAASLSTALSDWVIGNGFPAPPTVFLLSKLLKKLASTPSVWPPGEVPLAPSSC